MTRSALSAALATILAWGAAATSAPEPAAPPTTESDLRRLLDRPTAPVLRLPPGTTDITREILLPRSATPLTIEGDPAGTTVLRAAASFTGRAILVIPAGSTRLTLRNLTIDGNRAALERLTELTTREEKPFSLQYPNNGVVADHAAQLTLTRVRFRAIANYALIATSCAGLTLDEVDVTNSGSRNPHGRNNASGGILIEEGSANFTVRRCRFRNIRGNALWTHSWASSPRNRDGLIRDNTFDTIARDAIQIGHAVNIRVEHNTGRRIGYPSMEVDRENGATPVGIDTSGNVEAAVYTHNTFWEFNGKCIDLDGFHDGEVTHNTCINRGSADDYPDGHFAIVVNNWNPAMESANVTIADNLVDGAKFGGIFLLGRNHKVERNRLLHLNLAHCNDSAAKYGCVAIAGESDVLQAGIYLGRIAAEWAQKRADASRGHLIAGNTISGFRMKLRCILPAPGVSLAASRVESNTCEDSPGDRP